MTKNYSEMTGPELVAAYNEMANSPAGKALKRPTVKRFGNRKAGISRCEEFADEIASKPATAKKATAKKAPTAGGEDKRKGLRKGTNREKLITFMIKHVNKQVTMEQIQAAVYGEASPDLKTSIDNILRGVKYQDIAVRKLPYKLVKEKTEKGITYGLHED